MHVIKRIGKEHIDLAEGKTLDRNFGHLDHGYAVTSHASQGKTVDNVILVQTGRSPGATSAEQLYVSATRGRRSLRIYTDDKEALCEVATRGRERHAAIEIFPDGIRHDHFRPPMPLNSPHYAELQKEIEPNLER